MQPRLRLVSTMAFGSVRVLIRCRTPKGQANVQCEAVLPTFTIAQLVSAALVPQSEADALMEL